MSNVIEIRFGEDLGSKAKNELRYRLELARWKLEWRIAESMGDYLRMDELQARFERIGLP